MRNYIISEAIVISWERQSLRLSRIYSLKEKL